MAFLRNLTDKCKIIGFEMVKGSHQATVRFLLPFEAYVFGSAYLMEPTTHIHYCPFRSDVLQDPELTFNLTRSSLPCAYPIPFPQTIQHEKEYFQHGYAMSVMLGGTLYGFGKGVYKAFFAPPPVNIRLINPEHKEEQKQPAVFKQRLFQPKKSFAARLAAIDFPQEQIPDYFCCPFSGSLMEEPVFFHGKICDRHSLQHWLEKKEYDHNNEIIPARDPATNEPLTLGSIAKLERVLSTESAIESFVTEQEQKAREKQIPDNSISKKNL